MINIACKESNDFLILTIHEGNIGNFYPEKNIFVYYIYRIILKSFTLRIISIQMCLSQSKSNVLHESKIL